MCIDRPAATSSRHRSGAGARLPLSAHLARDRRSYPLAHQPAGELPRHRGPSPGRVVRGVPPGLRQTRAAGHARSGCASAGSRSCLSERAHGCVRSADADLCRADAGCVGRQGPQRAARRPEAGGTQFLPFHLPAWAPTPGRLRFKRSLRTIDEFVYRPRREPPIVVGASGRPGGAAAPGPRRRERRGDDRSPGAG